MIPKVIRSDPLGTLNVWCKFHGNQMVNETFQSGPE